MLGHNNSRGHADNIIKSKELFEFAVSYLTNKGYYHWDFSNYVPTADSKRISLSYFTDTGTIGISLLNEQCANRSAVLQLSDRLQITTVLDILLFAIEKDE